MENVIFSNVRFLYQGMSGNWCRSKANYISIGDKKSGVCLRNQPKMHTHLEDLSGQPLFLKFKAWTPLPRPPPFKWADNMEQWKDEWKDKEIHSESFNVLTFNFNQQ